MRDRPNVPVTRSNYKKQELPEEYIRKLADEGMGSKMISAKLKVEHDTHASYKTIQRVLRGEGDVVTTMEKEVVLALERKALLVSTGAFSRIQFLEKLTLYI